MRTHELLINKSPLSVKNLRLGVWWVLLLLFWGWFCGGCVVLCMLHSAFQENYFHLRNADSGVHRGTAVHVDFHLRFDLLGKRSGEQKIRETKREILSRPHLPHSPRMPELLFSVLTSEASLNEPTERLKNYILFTEMSPPRAPDAPAHAHVEWYSTIQADPVISTVLPRKGDTSQGE